MRKYIVQNLFLIYLALSFPDDWECKSCTEKNDRDDAVKEKKVGILLFIMDGHI